MAEIIGRVVATEKKPTTIDYFVFWTDQDLVLNPFDIIKVEHVAGSFTFGVVEDIGHITDAQSFLTNFISSDFGDLAAPHNTLRVGMNYVEARVIHNTENIYTPVQNDRPVMLATAEEINKALGLDNIKNPLVCGYLEMYEGTVTEKKGRAKVALPVRLNSKFIIGPEGAHLNISGISGLASKTSYAMFLLKAIQDEYLNHKKTEDDDSIAFVFFNVKGKDLLAVDQPNDFSDESAPDVEKKRTLEIYRKLGITPEPFKNVHYYYPYASAKSSVQNTYLPSDMVADNMTLHKASKFKYVYEDDKDSIDLLFSNVDDSTGTMDAILNFILSEQGAFAKDEISNWKEFLVKVNEMCQAGKTGNKEIPVVSWRKFYMNVSKAITSDPMFATRVDDQNGEVRLGDAIKHVHPGEVHVIDIAKLTEEKQSFVFGDVMRTIYNLQLGQYSMEDDVKPPRRIVIFIDELNKYASKDAPKKSPILRQVLDIAERGRSLGIVLFAAEQFRSAIHERVTGNCSTHAYGRTNDIELTKADYRSIPPVYKNMMTRLRQGEYIIQNPVFRSLLSIKFPKPIYKQFK